MHAPTSGHFVNSRWEEEPLGPDAKGPRLARASVANTFTGVIEAADTTCAYAIAYAADGGGSYAGMQLLVGRVAGREGSLLLEERGSFGADGTVRGTFEVVAGSGTGELSGLRGTGGFTHRPGETRSAYGFEHDFAEPDAAG
ncbi:DUF3224 domain-containing protein [Streptomyces calidiresistens]|uniref:DUF3224 domain-containing protein n=1 Tax=Streptomyces calidiresistens TaxID=1485586 RepID=UPI002B204C5E|nr:DUF3224 domain-containing protein [Streptomyces calidiresistens]